MIFIKILNNFRLFSLLLLLILIKTILAILNLIARYFIIIIPFIFDITSHIPSKIIITVLVVLMCIAKLARCKSMLILEVGLVYPAFHVVGLYFHVVFAEFLRVDCVVCHGLAWCYFLSLIVKLFWLVVVLV
jgi:hypothetical protein